MEIHELSHVELFQAEKDCQYPKGKKSGTSSLLFISRKKKEANGLSGYTAEQGTFMNWQLI